MAERRAPRRRRGKQAEVAPTDAFVSDAIVGQQNGGPMLDGQPVSAADQFDVEPMSPTPLDISQLPTPDPVTGRMPETSGAPSYASAPQPRMDTTPVSSDDPWAAPASVPAAGTQTPSTTSSQTIATVTAVVEQASSDSPGSGTGGVEDPVLRDAISSLDDLFADTEPVAAQQPPVPTAAAVAPAPAPADVAHDPAEQVAHIAPVIPHVPKVPEDDRARTNQYLHDAGVGNLTKATPGPESVARIDVYEADSRSSEERARIAELVRRIKPSLGNPQIGQAVRNMQLTRDLQVDFEQRQDLETLLRPVLGELHLSMGATDLPQVVDMLYDDLIGLGPLGVPWRDDNVTEILVDGWNHVYVEHNGRLLDTDLSFIDAEHSREIARLLARIESDRAISASSPLVTAYVAGCRVNVVYGDSVCAQGLAMTIRKPRPLMGMNELLAVGSLTEEMRDFLHDIVAGRLTTLISGGTGVGKTTIINSMSEFIPDSERVITIEDVFELKLRNRFVVSLQTKEKASADDEIVVDQEHHLTNSLRMRPDRIIVGEIREPRAAAVMLQAASSGHEGTMTTIHADDADTALNTRLAWMISAGLPTSDHSAKSLIADTFDIVVQAIKPSQQRFISSIGEVSADSLDDERDKIVPRPIFIATSDSDGIPTFQRVGGLDPTGKAVLTMRKAGIDPTRWLA